MTGPADRCGMASAAVFLAVLALDVAAVGTALVVLVEWWQA